VPGTALQTSHINYQLPYRVCPASLRYSVAIIVQTLFEQ
jgi:hypothetical protein